MKKRFTFLMAAMMLLAFFAVPTGMRGQTTDSYTATSDDKPTATNGTTTGTVTGTNSTSWSYSVTQETKSGKSPYVSFSEDSGWQLGSGNSPCTAFSISTSSISGTITKIETITGSKSSSSNINVTVNGQNFGTQNQSTGNGATVSTQTFEGSASGTIIVSATASSAAFYFKSVTVTYTSGSGPSTTYTVTYDGNGADGGTAPTDDNEYNSGDEVTVLGPGDLAKTGNTFFCWSDEQDGTGNLYDPTDNNSNTFSITENTTLYAQWLLNEYNVAIASVEDVVLSAAYGTNSTLGEGENADIDYGTQITLSYSGVASGHVFGSWVITKNEGSVDVTSQVLSENTLTVPDYAITVSATVPQAQQYTVTFDAGSGSSVASMTCFQGSSITLPTATLSATCVSEGWSFAGWATASVSETTTAPALLTGSYSATGDVTLYAVYTMQEGSGTPTAFSVGNTGSYAIVAGPIDDKYYALPTNPTINNGKITAQEITVSETSGVKFIKTSDATNFTWTIASATNGYTLYDGSKYIYHSNGGSSGTDLAYGNSTTLTWSFTADGDFIKMYGMSNGETGSRGMLFNGTTIGGYSMTNWSSYNKTMILPVTEAAITYYSSSPCLEQVATPSFSPAAGTYTSAQSVTISCETSGATIYYTTNGDTPTTSSGVYSGAITVSENTTIKAMATKENMNNSAVAEAAYTIVVTNTYNLVTSLTPGKHYIIVGFNNDNAYAMGNQNGNNRIAVAINSYSTSVANQFAIPSNAGVYEVVISGDATNNYTFYDAQNTGFLYAASSGSNWLKTQTNNDANGQWGILIDSNDGEASVEAQGTNTRNNMKFNSQSTLFSCYDAQNSQNSVYFYEKTGDNDCHIYSTTDISSDMTVTGDMNIHEDGWVTVKNGATLTVEGTITNIVAADLVIEDGGQLKTNNAVQKATVKKNIAKWSAGDVFGWYFIASPINSNSLDPSTVGNMITPDASSEHTYDLYRLDMSATDGKEWRNYRASSFNLVNGMGYLYANYNNDTLNFSGAILPTNETKEVTGLKANDYNLVGNPYTCNAYVNTAYYTINDAYNGITAETSTSSSAIAPCTGIIVKTAAEVTTVKFGTSTPVTSANHGNIKMVLAQQVTTRGESNEQTFDNAIVSFNEGEVLPKFYFGTQNANIYIPQNGEEYAIVSAKPFGTIPVNFRAEKDGQYTLNIGVEEAEMNYLHLVDNMTGADVDLLVNPSYTFNARNNDYESRFKLVFSNSNTDEAEAQSDFAFISNGNLIVAGTGTLQIVDMMGRTIGSYNASDLISTSDLAQGVYVLRLVNGDNVKTQKIVVK